MKPLRSLPADAVIGAACVLGGMLLILHWTHFGKIIYALDTYAYVDPWNRIAKQLFLWNTYNSAGGDVHWDFSAWPAMTLFAALSWIFGSSAAQTLQIGLVLGFGWAAMYAMLRLLRFDRGVALIGTCGYAFNPWTMTLMQDFTINGTLFAIPAVGALLIAAARFPNYRGPLRLGLILIAAVVAAVIAVEPARLTVTLFLFLLFAVPAAFLETNDRPAFSRWLLGSAVLSFFAALWWMPTLLQYFLLKPATPTQISEFIGDVRRASLDNVLRFLPIWGWTFPQYYNYARAYDANALSYTGGFALATFGAISLVFRERARAPLVRLSVFWALAILFLAKGLHEPLSWINALVYRIPGSVMWREPTTKFPPVALAALAICTAVVFERLARSGLDARLRSATIAAALVLFGFSAQALFVGNAWFGSTFSLSSAWVTIPHYWYDAARWLNSRPDESAMATLPQLNHYQARYTWGMQAWDWLPTDMFHRRNVVLNTVFALKSQQDDAIHALIDEAAANPALPLKSVLRNLGVRYVLFRGDAVPAAIVKPTLEDVRRRLPGAPERDFGALAIFDLGPADDALVTTGRSWIAGNYARAPTRGLMLTALLENVPRLDVARLKNAVPGVAPVAYELNGGDPPRLGRAVRYLWDDTTGPFTARFPANAPVTVERVARLVPEHRTAVTVSASRFVRGESSGQRLLTVLDPVQVSDAELDLAVVNPSPTYVTASIEIALRPDAPATYVLTANERAYETSVRASRDQVWVRFARVILKSGVNRLAFGTIPITGAAAQAQPAAGVEYGRIRARVERALRAVDDASYVADLGSVPIRAAALQEPLIDVALGDVFPGVSPGAVVTFGLRKVKYRCYAAFETQTERIDVASGIAGCLRTAGIEPTVETMRAATVDAVTFVALLPDFPRESFVQPIRSATVSWLDGDGVAVKRSGTTVSVDDRSAQTALGVIGLPRMHGVEPQSAPLKGLLPAAAIVHASAGYVHLRQTYDRAWLALCLGGCAFFPSHVQDAAGWNLWWIAGSGTVAIVNLLVVLQLLCYVASAVAVAIAVRTAVRCKDDPRF